MLFACAGFISIKGLNLLSTFFSLSCSNNIFEIAVFNGDKPLTPYMMKKATYMHTKITRMILPQFLIKCLKLKTNL